THAHPVACKRRQIDIGHRAGGRVTPPENRLGFGLQQDRLDAADVDLQDCALAEDIRGRAADDILDRAIWQDAAQTFGADAFRIDRRIPDQAAPAVFAENDTRPVSVAAVWANLHSGPLYQARMLGCRSQYTDDNEPTRQLATSVD